MKKKKGVSLVEILVALAIIGISSILLFGAMSNSSIAIGKTGIRQQNFQKTEYGLSTALEEDNTIDGNLELVPTDTQTAQQKADEFGITVAKDAYNNTLQTYTFNLDSNIKIDYETFVADVTPKNATDNDYLFNINVDTPDIPTFVDPEGEATFNMGYWDAQDPAKGYTAELTLKNKSDMKFENWQLEFDFPNEITTMWGAQIVSHEGNRYVIKGESWSPSIDVGGVVQVGFSCDKELYEGPPTNYKFISDGYVWP